MKDKRRFFIEATALAANIQETMSKKLAALRQPDTKKEPDVPSPPDLGKLVKVKTHGDRAAGRVTRRLPESEVLISGGKRIHFVAETKFFRRMEGRWYVASETGEPVEAVSYKIAETQVPYQRKVTMDAGDALTFELPNGKSVAVWCEGGMMNFAAAEQTTACGLKTRWGEKPFKHVGYKREKQPDGSVHLGETNSYIKQGVVSTRCGDTSTYQLFVDKWEFDIVEDLQGKEALPVTILVTERKGGVAPKRPAK